MKRATKKDDTNVGFDVDVSERERETVCVSICSDDETGNQVTSWW